MEYRGYTPEEVNKDKNKKLFGIIALAIPMLLGLFLLFGGIVSIIGIRVEDASEVSYTAMESGEEYFFEELVLVDVYSGYGNDVVGFEASDYIVYFIDQNGTVVYTSLRPEEYSDLAQKCEDYINDPELTIGDVVLTGCFHGYGNGATIRDYLKDAYDECNAVLPGELLDWTFFFDDVETKEEYRQKEISQNMVMFIFAGVIIVPCVIGMIVLVRKRKELDRYIQEYNNAPNTF